jgi:hypothetical protein
VRNPDSESSCGLITHAWLAVLSLMSAMQSGLEDPRDRLLDNLSPAELRFADYALFSTKDSESHTGEECWLRRDRREQEREEQLSKGRHVQDAAGLAAGAHGLEEPHLAGVEIGSRATASTGVSKGSVLEYLLRPSHLTSEVP